MSEIQKDYMLPYIGQLYIHYVYKVEFQLSNPSAWQSLRPTCPCVREWPFLVEPVQDLEILSVASVSPSSIHWLSDASREQPAVVLFFDLDNLYVKVAAYKNDYWTSELSMIFDSHERGETETYTTDLDASHRNKLRTGCHDERVWYSRLDLCFQVTGWNNISL